MPRALIALGSNLGDRRTLLDATVQRLSATAGVQSLRASSWHETKAIGGPKNQPPFLNGAAVVETSLSPEALLARLEAIEQELGRTRQERWGPRTIDLDLLLFDDAVLDTPKLKLPHPHMALRRFVLEPSAEVAPSMVHPKIGWTVSQLRDHLRSAVSYVALSTAGLPEPLQHAARQLAQAVTGRLPWQALETLPIPSLDSPSLTASRAIEFLRREAKVLARSSWPAEPAGAISSFWIEDVLALGDVLWPDALESTWQALTASIIPPKLLVLHSEPSLPQDNQSLRQRLAVAARIRANRLGIGPVLWLNFAEPDAAEAELVAAIESMN